MGNDINVCVKKNIKCLRVDIKRLVYTDVY